ncbi:hypothetical protein BKA83DRAFT_1169843 [Pisolithus microcarpus]|nr:hypothetical protein BKA83DRAFT_1169843 [Pisolithus microcarpus]
MTKICDVILPTLFRHENSDNSATTNARVTSHISSGRFRLVESRLKTANNSARNCLSYGPNALGARRAALRRWGTAWRCPTKLWEAVEMDMGSWEKKESGEKVPGTRKRVSRWTRPPKTECSRRVRLKALDLNNAASLDCKNAQKTIGKRLIFVYKRRCTSKKRLVSRRSRTRLIAAAKCLRGSRSV